MAERQNMAPWSSADFNITYFGWEIFSYNLTFIKLFINNLINLINYWVGRAFHLWLSLFFEQKSEGIWRDPAQIISSCEKGRVFALSASPFCWMILILPFFKMPGYGLRFDKFEAPYFWQRFPFSFLISFFPF